MASEQQLRLIFPRGSTPEGAFGDFLSDLFFGSRYRSDLLTLFHAEFARSVFSEIEANFLSKSAGGGGMDNRPWQDLRPRTKAYKRPELRRGLTLSGPKSRPTLPPQIDRVWRRIFAQNVDDTPSLAGPARVFRSTQQRVLPFLNEVLASREARAAAAQRAWIEVKRRFGDVTLIAFLQGSRAQILNRSGDLALSLSPEDGTPYRPKKGQLFRVGFSTIVLGSTLPYAGTQHAKRPFWPSSEVSAMGQRAALAAFEAVYEASQS